jgi:hypothetical protein
MVFYQVIESTNHNHMETTDWEALKLGLQSTEEHAQVIIQSPSQPHQSAFLSVSIGMKKRNSQSRDTTTVQGRYALRYARLTSDPKAGRLLGKRFVIVALAILLG